jgi:spermidine/putrescine ABC transporter ATP-binding subunit
MRAHVEIRRLTKRFGETVAVEDLSLEVQKGEFITLLGPSGCGKTTTLRMIAGFVEPDRGEIYLNGRFLNNVPAHRRNVAMVFQSYALFPHMNVFNNVAYGLKLRKKSRQEIGKRVREVLELLNMEGMEKRYPHQLSGGQQQRVALARALVLEPEALLMDEPLSNLDAKLRVAVRNELKELQKHFGITTIYVTHDQEEALAISDKIAVMKEGILQQLGDPWEIYRHPVNRFVADFIGTANLLEAVVEKSGPGFVELGIAGEHILISREGLDLAIGQKILINIRPENLRLFKEPTHVMSEITLKGRIKRNTYMGRTIQYWVQMKDGTELIVEEHAPETVLDGEIYIGFDSKHIEFVSMERKCWV